MNHMKRKQHACVLILGAVLAIASVGAAAQSLEASVFVGVSNIDYGGDLNILDLGHDQSAGGLAQVELEPTDFTGLNDSGSTDTMTFSGGASAFVIVPGYRPGLHVAAYGSLLNSFYSMENPPYFDASNLPPTVDENGVPDYFAAYGEATMVELLSFGGFGAGQYLASYTYHIHGFMQGDGFNTAVLFYQVGSNPVEIASFGPNLPNGEIVGTYRTQRYVVGNGMSHEQRTTFAVMYQAYSQEMEEGSDIVGTVDFGETVTLDHIDVVDENNNPVYGWTVTAASGLDYDLPIFRSDFEPVAPEPDPIAANAAQICARLHDVQRSMTRVLRRTSLCDQPIGAISEIKFRKVGAN